MGPAARGSMWRARCWPLRAASPSLTVPAGRPLTLHVSDVERSREVYARVPNSASAPPPTRRQSELLKGRDVRGRIAASSLTSRTRQNRPTLPGVRRIFAWSVTSNLAWSEPGDRKGRSLGAVWPLRQNMPYGAIGERSGDPCGRSGSPPGAKIVRAPLPCRGSRQSFFAMLHLIQKKYAGGLSTWPNPITCCR